MSHPPVSLSFRRLSGHSGLRTRFGPLGLTGVQPSCILVLPTSQEGNTKVTFADTQAALGVAIAARTPVLLWGAPGQGKTKTITTLAHSQGMHLETILASVREPSDFAGLPFVDNGRTVLMAPDWARRIADKSESGKSAMLFLDEVSTAPPATQAALLRVVLDRVAGDTYLGDDVAIVAAANPPEIAADGWDLAPPMANRFVHLEWALPSDTVREGFMMGWSDVPVPTVDTARVEAEVRSAMQLVGAFLGARPDLTTVMPTASSEAGRAFPTPRSWETAATLYGYSRAANVSPVASRMLLVGAIGQAAAVEFLAYVADLDLPDPEQVLADPDSFEVPTRGDRVYAVGASVLAAVQADNTDERWLAAGKVIAKIAGANHADVAVAIGKRWMTVKPSEALRPDADSLRALAPILKEAGLIEGGTTRRKASAKQ